MVNVDFGQQIPEGKFGGGTCLCAVMVLPLMVGLGHLSQFNRLDAFPITQLTAQ